MSRRILAALAALGLAIITLTGCDPGAAGSTEAPSDGLRNDHIRVGYVELPDGREVLCVSNKRGYAGGLSCDWDGATE